MEEIIVEIYLPGANASFDFLMPAQIPVEYLLGELGKAIQSCTNFVRVDEEAPMLINAKSGQVLSLEKTLAENQICDGNRLILL